MNTALQGALKKAKKVVASFAGFLVSAFLWVILLFLGGTGLISYGVLLMFGAGQALVVTGVSMICLAAMLKKAVTDE